MNKKQRQTLDKIFERPDRSDIPWVNIESLFIALGGDISEGRRCDPVLFSRDYINEFYKFLRMLR